MRKVILPSAILAAFVVSAWLVADSNAITRVGKATGTVKTPAYLLMSDPNAPPQKTQAQMRTEWIMAVLKEIQTIKPGMTRENLRRVFTGDGGISTRTQRTYCYRDCQYIKVDVVFKAVGPRDRFNESPLDEIVTISRPYLNWPAMD